ncbi:drug/metabolite transporter (DMT)-like permease [Brevibacterium pityocampae]
MGVLAAAAFAFIWSTGFVVGRFIHGAAEPNVFLALRFGIAAVLLFAVCAIRRPPMPDARTVGAHLGIGALVNGVYLCLVYIAIADGLPAGIMALFGGWQPVLTVLVVALLTRRAPRVTVVLGIAASLTGLVLVLGPGMRSGAITGLLLVLAVLAALLLGERLPGPSLQLFGALAWSVLGISVVGMALMLHLVRTTSPTTVAIVVLAAPPLAAVQTYLLFGDTLTLLQVAGVVVSLVGVGVARVAEARSALPGRVGPASEADGEDPAGRRLG